MTEVNETINQMDTTTEGDQTDLSEGTEGVIGGVVGLFTGVFGGVKIGEAKTIKAVAKAEGKTVEEVRKMIKPEKPKKEKGKIKFQWPVTREKVSEPKSADNSANNGNNVKDEDKNTSSAS